MKKIVVRYGLIAGAIVGAGLLLSMLLFKMGALNMDNGAVFGYSIQLIAFTAIYFGIQKYRDDVNNGVLSFGKALSIGMLIALIAGLIYCVTWEIYYQATDQQFMNEYSELYLNKLKESGISETKLSEAMAEMETYKKLYQNPLIRFGFTMLEIIPMGLLISLVSAAMLRKRRQ
jgi:hypothetical protein